METSKPTTPEQKASSTWERLEEFVRKHVQQFIQALLEEEARSYWDVRMPSALYSSLMVPAPQGLCVT